MKITKEFTDGPWTEFHDMHSGGDMKIPPFGKIYIQAPQDEAERVFYSKFGRNPNRVTCTCCGEDYSITSSDDLYEATAYERGCEYDNDKKAWVERQGTSRLCWNKYMTLDAYVNSRSVMFVPKTEIDEDDRTVRLPRQGYVWVDED